MCCRSKYTFFIGRIFKSTETDKNCTGERARKRVKTHTHKKLHTYTYILWWLHFLQRSKSDFIMQKVEAGKCPQEFTYHHQISIFCRFFADRGKVLFFSLTKQISSRYLNDAWKMKSCRRHRHCFPSFPTKIRTGGNESGEETKRYFPVYWYLFHVKYKNDIKLICDLFFFFGNFSMVQMNSHMTVL